MVKVSGLNLIRGAPVTQPVEKGTWLFLELEKGRQSGVTLTLPTHFSMLTDQGRHEH